MSRFSTLLALFVDDVAKARWHGHIAKAARDVGLAIIESPAGSTYEPEHDAVILTDDINWALLLAPSETAVFSDGALPWPSSARPSIIERGLIFEHSRRLIVAAHLGARGAPVFNERDTQADLPLVGRVVAEDFIAEDRERPRGPLDMYRTIPPALGASAVWGGELFAYPSKDQLDGGDPHIDLTGRSRAVVHGPYYYLTPGVWRSVTDFTVDPDGGEARLRLEWGTAPEMTAHSVSFTTAGKYRIELEHAWQESGPAQLVVWVERPLFQGRLHIESCTVTRVA
jgi:hypothetical protein